MPPTAVRVFRSAAGGVQLLDWLEQLQHDEPKAHTKCLAYIVELADKGFDMRRPHADLLRDGIYELRPSFRGIHYRILYFFVGKTAVLSHGLKKSRIVPPKEIDLAISHRKLVERNPEIHTADEIE